MATPYRPGLLAHGKRLAGRCDALVNHLNVQRIYQDIDATARMAGATGDGGVERLALDAHDLVVRQWFREQAEELGLAYTIDDMGCQRATLAGQTPHAAPIGIGSHFDTTPCGGRFDGVLGMMCGLEVLRSYRGAGITPLRPISVINWTGEEGSRFGQGCIASSVWSGMTKRQEAWSRTDAQGTTLGEALEATGYKGRIVTSATSEPLSAHFEVHIEQGTRLQSANLPLGVTIDNVGCNWSTAHIGGVSQHAETTPLGLRRDALVGAAHMILAVRRISEQHQGVGTVTIIDSQPRSGANIPGTVDLLYSIVNEKQERLEAQKRELEARLQTIAESSGLTLGISRHVEIDTFAYGRPAVDCALSAVEQLGCRPLALTSHTMHDSSFTNIRCPSAVIMVRCRDGISHNPHEYATADDCALAARALLLAVENFAMSAP